MTEPERLALEAASICLEQLQLLNNGQHIDVLEVGDTLDRIDALLTGDYQPPTVPDLAPVEGASNG